MAIAGKRSGVARARFKSRGLPPLIGRHARCLREPDYAVRQTV